MLCVCLIEEMWAGHVSSQSGDKYRQEGPCLLTQSVSVQM